MWAYRYKRAAKQGACFVEEKTIMRRAVVSLSTILFSLAALPAEPGAPAPTHNAPSETALGKLAASTSEMSRFETEMLTRGDNLHALAELTLRTTPKGVRMFAEPVKELATLYRKTDKFKPMTLTPVTPWTYQGDKDGLQVIELEFVVSDKTLLSMALPGYTVRWNRSRRGTIVKGLTPVDGRVRLQILLDRTSVEICCNRGQAMLTAKRGDVPLDGTIRMSGNAQITELTVHAVNSAWPDTTKVVVSP